VNRLFAGTTRRTLQTEVVPGPAEKHEVTGSTPVPTTGKGQFRGAFLGGRLSGRISCPTTCPIAPAPALHPGLGRVHDVVEDRSRAESRPTGWAY
jgi:hypothetical protein